MSHVRIPFIDELTAREFNRSAGLKFTSTSLETSEHEVFLTLNLTQDVWRTSEAIIQHALHRGFSDGLTAHFTSNEMDEIRSMLVKALDHTLRQSDLDLILKASPEEDEDEIVLCTNLFDFMSTGLHYFISKLSTNRKLVARRQEIIIEVATRWFLVLRANNRKIKHKEIS